jgi:hypothetical protein
MKSLQQLKIGTFSFRMGVPMSEVISALEQFHFHLLRLRDCLTGFINEARSSNEMAPQLS